MNDFLNDPRFAGIEPFPSKVWLSSPTMHGEERKWVDDAILTNWVSTVGANINAVEEEIAEYVHRNKQYIRGEVLPKMDHLLIRKFPTIEKHPGQKYKVKD